MRIFNTYHTTLLREANKTPEIFWDINSKNLRNLSNEALLERLLNLGNINQFKTVTKNKKAFRRYYKNLTKKKRPNLRPEVQNYVNLYLKHNA